MKAPYDELRSLIEKHGIPTTVEPMPEWLGSFLTENQIKFAEPEFVIDWLQRPEKWFLGERFSLDDVA